MVEDKAEFFSADAEFFSRPGAILLAFLGLLAVLWFAGLELRGLFIPDEARYAEIPREMLASGDWVTPRLNDLKYFEKPPLQYWATAAIYAVFGEDEWTARLWSALTGFAGVIVVLLTAARLWSWRVGAFAATVLASSWGYFLSGQYLTLDMGLTFFLTCALCAFLLAQCKSIPAAQQRRFMLAAWLSAALAVLSKGLIGIVLPVLCLGVYTIVSRDWSVLRRLHARRGATIFLAAALPWFVLVQMHNPEFFGFFFIHEHFQRFAAAAHHRPGPWWYFIPVILVGTMPWTPIVLRSLVHRQGPHPACRPSLIRPEKLLQVWVPTVVIFFSASSSKLPAYVLPALPAVAMLTAIHIEREKSQCLRAVAIMVLLAALAFFAVIPGLPNQERFAGAGSLIRDNSAWLYGAAALLAAGGLAAWFISRTRPIFAIATLTLISLASWHLGFIFLHSVDSYFSAEQFIEDLTQEHPPFRPDVPFYSVGMFDHGVPFYLGRTLILVAHKSELGPGIAAEPSKYLNSILAFEDEWRSCSMAFAIMPPQTYEALFSRGLPMRLVSRDSQRVIVARS